MDTGTARTWGATAVGGSIVLAAWAIRGTCPGHGLPVIAPPEDWIDTFVALDRSVGAHALDAVAHGAHLALLHLEYLLSYVVLRVQGAVPDLEAFSVLVVQDPVSFWTLARSVGAVLGAVTVAIVFRHGLRLGGLVEATLAAAFLAASAGHVEMSRRVTPDASAVLLTFWALARIAEAADSKRPVRGWAFVPVCGAAFRAGWPGVLLAIPYVRSAWLAGRARGLFSARGLLPLTGAAGLAGLAVLASAGSVRVPLGREWAAEGTGILTGSIVAGHALIHGAGVGLVALAGLGVVLAIRTGPAGPRFHTLFAALVVLALLAGFPGPARAAAILLPSACLLAAFALRELTRRLHGPAGLEAVVLIGVALIVVAEPGRAALRLMHTDCAPDTRQLSAAWIEDNVLPRTSVAVAVSPELPWEPAIPVHDLKRNLKDRLAHVRGENPRAIRYWETRLRTCPDREYDLQLVESPDAWESAAAYRARGLRYAVIPLPSAEATDTAAGRLRAELADLSGAELCVRFAPFGELTRGPRLEIWQVTPPGGNEERSSGARTDEE